MPEEINVYNLTESKEQKDGKPAYRAGDTVRMLGDDTRRAFYDAVICGFDKNDNARLARPYGMVVGHGTTSPRCVVGIEYMDMVNVKTMANYWRKVDSGRVFGRLT